MPRRNPFPNLTRVTDRHGKTRWRYRRAGFSAYIHGEYGSAEFRASYEAAVAQSYGGQAPKPTRAAHGTLAWLIEQYRGSMRFQNASVTWQRNLLRHFDWLREQAGDKPYARMEPRHVELLMARKEGPAAANEVRKVVRLLYTFASARLGYTGSNPAKGADRRKTNAEGFHTWTPDEVDRFLEAHGPGTKARLALLLALNTGMSRQDLCAAGWQLVRGGRIAYRRGKTGGVADMPILPELEEELALVPRDRMLFLVREDGSGRAHTANGLGTWFAKQRAKAGVPGSLHGLRKAGAVRLAEAGASEQEIMCFLGHTHPGTASVYVRAANRARMTDSGLARLARKTGET